MPNDVGLEDLQLAVNLNIPMMSGLPEVGEREEKRTEEKAREQN